MENNYSLDYAATQVPQYLARKGSYNVEFAYQHLLVLIIPW